MEPGILEHIPIEKAVEQKDSRGSTVRHAIGIHGGGKSSVENPCSRIQFKRETRRTLVETKIKNQVAQRRRT